MRILRLFLGNLSLLALASLLLLPLLGQWRDVETAVKAGCVWTDAAGAGHRFNRLFETAAADTPPASVAAHGSGGVGCAAPGLAGLTTEAYTVQGADGPALTIDGQGVVGDGTWAEAPSPILAALLLPIITIAAVMSAGAALVIIFAI